MNKFGDLLDMASWKTRGLKSPLLGEDTGVPVHHHLTADLGHSFFWEERYFLHALRVTDHTDFLKRQKKRGDMKALEQQWGLVDTDAPGSDHDFLKMASMSSACLLPWLFLQVISFLILHSH